MIKIIYLFFNIASVDFNYKPTVCLGITPKKDARMISGGTFS